MRIPTPTLPTLLRVFGLLVVSSLVSEIFAEKINPTDKKSITAELEDSSDVTQYQMDQFLASLKPVRTYSPTTPTFSNEAEHNLAISEKSRELKKLWRDAMQSLLMLYHNGAVVHSTKSHTRRTYAYIDRINDELKNAAQQAEKVIDSNSKNLQVIQQSIDTLSNALEAAITTDQKLSSTYV